MPPNFLQKLPPQNASAFRWRVIHGDYKEQVSNYYILKQNYFTWESLNKIDTVTKQIEAIPDVDKLKVSDEAMIDQAMVEYLKLTEAEQARVSNYSVLVTAQNAVALLKQNVAENAVTETVNNLISLIDSIGEVTLDSGAVINQAGIIYKNMTPEQQEMVTNYDVLLAAQTEYNNQVAKLAENNIATTIGLINAIGTVELTDESFNKICDAFYAYSDLTEEEKAKVTNYDILKSAEDKYDELNSNGDVVESSDEEDAITWAFGSLFILAGICLGGSLIVGLLALLHEEFW